jgi:hypothetical protein
MFQSKNGQGFQVCLGRGLRSTPSCGLIWTSMKDLMASGRTGFTLLFEAFGGDQSEREFHNNFWSVLECVPRSRSPDAFSMDIRSDRALVRYQETFDSEIFFSFSLKALQSTRPGQKLYDQSFSSFNASIEMGLRQRATLPGLLRLLLDCFDERKKLRYAHGARLLDGVHDLQRLRQTSFESKYEDEKRKLDASNDEAAALTQVLKTKIRVSTFNAYLVAADNNPDYLNVMASELFLGDEWTGLRAQASKIARGEPDQPRLLVEPSLQSYPTSVADDVARLVTLTSKINWETTRSFLPTLPLNAVEEPSLPQNAVKEPKSSKLGALQKIRRKMSRKNLHD